MTWIPGHEVTRECNSSSLPKEPPGQCNSTMCASCVMTHAERLRVGCIYVMEATE